MQLTLISDTHGLHRELKLPGGDLLLHAGDVTEYGTEEEVEDFVQWLERQAYAHKIFIAGNHDMWLEQATKRQKKKMIPSGIIYLENETVEVAGLHIYGSPVTPYFMGMAFNRKPGKTIQKEWKKFPVDTDILITHGPPFGLLDNGMGCPDLWSTLQRIQPKLHLFGHIHQQNGMIKKDHTTFVNAAVVNTIDPLELPEYYIYHQATEWEL